MSRYNSTNRFTNDIKRPFYGSTKYPVVPLSLDDIYVITQEDDRFDQLAQEYYGNSNLWWVIACSNPNLNQNSYFPPIGIQLRIPTNISQVINEQELLNAR